MLLQALCPAVTSLGDDLEDIFGGSSDEEEFLGFPESEPSDSESDHEALAATWQKVCAE